MLQWLRRGEFCFLSVTFLACAGCMSMGDDMFGSKYQAADVIDLTTGGKEGAVTINGQVGAYIPMAHDYVCYVRLLDPVSSGWSHKLIVDPGKSRLQSDCDHFSGVLTSRKFVVDLVAGHEYQVKWKSTWFVQHSDCIELYDQTAKKTASSNCSNGS